MLLFLQDPKLKEKLWTGLLTSNRVFPIDKYGLFFSGNIDQDYDSRRTIWNNWNIVFYKGLLKDLPHLFLFMADRVLIPKNIKNKKNVFC